MKIIALFFLLLSCNIFGQSGGAANLSRNNFGINILGEGSMVAAVYERNIILKNEHFLNIEFGLGLNHVPSFGLSPTSKSFGAIPHHLTYNIGRNSRSRVELGVGGCFLKSSEWNYVWFPIMGYRLQARDWFLRAYFSYILPEKTEIIRIPVGLCIGLSF